MVKCTFGSRENLLLKKKQNKNKPKALCLDKVKDGNSKD